MDQADFLIILFSLLFSAMFSGLEIAFISANKLKIELDNKLGFFNAKVLSFFNKNPSKFISTMLVGNNIALVVYGIFMAKILEPFFYKIFDSEFTVFLLQTVVSTLLILFIAEFLPKALFRINPNSILSLFAVPIVVIYSLLFPLIWISIAISNYVLKLFFNVKNEDGELNFRMVDLDNYLKEATSKTQNDESIETEVQIFQNALDFSKVKARECMVPRTEIEALDENTDLETLKNKFFETGFSKLLIYRDSIDNIIGYTHSFELFKKPINLKSILLPIPVIPESMPANEILEFFTKQKKSVAVVVDEFGGTSGMVTIEDVIEELFGDIEDEHDSEDLVEKVVSENEFIFSARLEIDYINEQYKLNLPESDEYETLAGYIIYLHESIPEKGNTIETAEFSFFITEVSTHKIEIVKVTKI
jgi:CBS domain containing-hemolysin-like protein